ncbi:MULTISPECIES: ArsC family reductase [unclassified Brevundimonas]|uniref:ArsC family reductase n=1 Tax=unclassified Brevundimonas TaxID=2622653 RepID=UPI0025B9DF9E|nr:MULTISPECIES: ArsC family reductase [unclassified Brevundimonas]
MAVIMYGIPNCDTVKKARTWLAENGVEFTFHDYKKHGVPADQLKQWVDEHGWEVVLNRAGTTFKKLPDEAKTDLNADKAIAFMIEQPSMIKRPILDLGAKRLVGFKADVYAASLK